MSKKSWYVSREFSLSVAMGPRGALLDMHVLNGVVNTSQLSFVRETLSIELPSVLRSQCFNPLGLSFFEEVRATEIGHLFEHVLLEYVCLLKVERGDAHAVHSGRTSWNVQQVEQGRFSIYVDVSKKDRRIFLKALARTILLMRLLSNMSSHFWLPMLTWDA